MRMTRRTRRRTRRNGGIRGAIPDTTWIDLMIGLDARSLEDVSEWDNAKCVAFVQTVYKEFGGDAEECTQCRDAVRVAGVTGGRLQPHCEAGKRLLGAKCEESDRDVRGKGGEGGGWKVDYQSDGYESLGIPISLSYSCWNRSGETMWTTPTTTMRMTRTKLKTTDR